MRKCRDLIVTSGGTYIVTSGGTYIYHRYLKDQTELSGMSSASDSFITAANKARH
jgi:hypothetical protein